MLPATIQSTVSLSLHVIFRSQGIKWPLRDHDKVEVWDAQSHVLYFTITGELLKTLLRHHLDALAVQALMRNQLDATYAPKIGEEPMPEQHPVTRERREQFRTARQARRKPPRKMLVGLGVAYAITSAYGLPDINDLFWFLHAVVEALL